MSTKHILEQIGLPSFEEALLQELNANHSTFLSDNNSGKIESQTFGPITEINDTKDKLIARVDLTIVEGKRATSCGDAYYTTTRTESVVVRITKAEPHTIEIELICDEPDYDYL